MWNMIFFLEHGARTPAMLAQLPDIDAVEASGKVREFAIYLSVNPPHEFN